MTFILTVIAHTIQHYSVVHHWDCCIAVVRQSHLVQVPCKSQVILYFESQVRSSARLRNPKFPRPRRCSLKWQYPAFIERKKATHSATCTQKTSNQHLSAFNSWQPHVSLGQTLCQMRMWNIYFERMSPGRQLRTLKRQHKILSFRILSGRVFSIWRRGRFDGFWICFGKVLAVWQWI